MVLKRIPCLSTWTHKATAESCGFSHYPSRSAADPGLQGCRPESEVPNCAMPNLHIPILDRGCQLPNLCPDLRSEHPRSQHLQPLAILCHSRRLSEVGHAASGREKRSFGLRAEAAPGFTGAESLCLLSFRQAFSGNVEHEDGYPESPKPINQGIYTLNDTAIPNVIQGILLN